MTAAPDAENRELLTLRAAKAYYLGDRTMGEIATELGLTRWQVGRLLREARENGTVRIEITGRDRRHPALESALERRWNLREAIVVPAAGTDPLEPVAAAAARFLAALQPPPAAVGVSWGRTMAAVAHRLPRGWSPAEIVLLNGAMDVHPAAHRTNNVAELFAAAGGGRATLLPVPAILGRAATRETLEADPVIAAVLARGRAAPVACFGLGGTGPDNVLAESGCLSAADLARLRDADAVGDVLGRFIDRDGAIADPALDARTIGLPLAALREKRLAIGVAAGPAKHAVVRAALRARLLDVLVTDEATAEAVEG